jgi:hypothetical protein
MLEGTKSANKPVVRIFFLYGEWLLSGAVLPVMLFSYF